MTNWDDEHWRARYASALGSATLHANRRAVDSLASSTSSKRGAPAVEQHSTVSPDRCLAFEGVRFGSPTASVLCDCDHVHVFAVNNATAWPVADESSSWTMKKRLVVLTAIALLLVGSTAESAFAWGSSPIGVYLCPVNHPHLSCVPLTGTCACY
jgi:hypothetical protein